MSIHDIWVVDQMHNILENGGEQLALNAAGRKPDLEINTTKLKIYGSDSCNEITADITKLINKEIIFGPIAAAKKLCSDMSVAQAYNQLLANVTSYQVKGLKLLLYDKDQHLILQFKKVD